MSDPMDDDYHCGNDCISTDDDPHPEECVHCDCCCQCLGCIYAPQDSVPLTEEQRAPIAAMTFASDEAAPNAGSAS